jgi:hypothetical protein
MHSRCCGLQATNKAPAMILHQKHAQRNAFDCGVWTLYTMYHRCSAHDHYRAVIASWNNSCPCCLWLHAPTERSKRNIRAYSGNISTAAMPDVFNTMDLRGPNDAKLIRLASFCVGTYWWAHFVFRAMGSLCIRISSMGSFCVGIYWWAHFVFRAMGSLCIHRHGLTLYSYLLHGLILCLYLLMGSLCIHRHGLTLYSYLFNGLILCLYLWMGSLCIHRHGLTLYSYLFNGRATCSGSMHGLPMCICCGDVGSFCVGIHWWAHFVFIDMGSPCIHICLMGSFCVCIYWWAHFVFIDMGSLCIHICCMGS